MATTDQEERIGEYESQGVPVGVTMPVTAPLSTNPSCLAGVGVDDGAHDTCKIYDQAFEPVSSEAIDLVHPENDLPAMEEDSMRTPKLKQTPLAMDSLTSKLLIPLQNQFHALYPGNGNEDITSSRHPEYFTRKAQQDLGDADISRTPSSSNVSSAGLGGSTTSQLDTTSTPVSPDSRASTWKEYTSSFKPESNRPVSVPNFQSKPLSRRRDGPDYPNYPDQSFRALQNQHYPPPYQPGEPHHLRTRSSQPSQNLSFSSSDEISGCGYPPVPSGAKTVGNTPAQSPGLFTPTLTKKHWTGDADESRSSTPMLHPAHLQAPKE